MPRSIPDLESITIHGHRRAYRLAGSGPLVLLIHGIGDSSVAWDSVFNQLTRNFTVLAPDLLGHGGSAHPRADYSVPGFANGMRDLMVTLGFDRATVVGHSLGGGIAGQFAYQYPHLVERLIFVAAGGVGTQVNPVLRLLSLPGSELAMSLLRLPGALAITQGINTRLRSIPGLSSIFHDADELNRVIAGLQVTGAPEVFARTLRSGVDIHGQVVSMLDRIYLTSELPTLIVWGDQDQVIPVAHAQLLADEIPGAQVEVFRGAGHFPFRDDPDRFLALFSKFVALTAPARLSGTDLADQMRARVRPGGPRVAVEAVSS